MNLKRIFLAFASLVMMSAGTPVLADLSPVTGFYFGAVGGQSRFGQHQQDFDRVVIDSYEALGDPVADGISDLDSEDLGFGVFAGYRIWDYLAIEAIYLDFGELEYRADVLLESNALASVTFNAATRGPAITVIGLLPFDGPWEVYGRAGIYSGDLEVARRDDVNGAVTNSSSSTSDQETIVGVGFGFHIGDHISVRAEYTQALDVGNEEIPEDNVSLINLHFVWRL